MTRSPAVFDWRDADAITGRSIWVGGRSALCCADGSDHTGDVDDSTLIELFRVLGDPVRWSVVLELRGGARCACELAEASGAAPSLLSHHLGVLRDAGVVTASRRWKWIDYTLVGGVLGHLADELDDAAVVRGGDAHQSGTVLVTGEMVVQ